MGRLAVIVAIVLAQAGPALAQETSREAELDGLFAQLREAESAEAADVLQREIEAIWHDAESASMNLIFLRAKSAIESGHLHAALEHLDDLVRLEPDFAEGWNARATVHYYLGNYSESREDIAETLLREPRHYGALSGLGLVFMAQREPAAALRSYRSALEVHPWLEGPRTMVEQLSDMLERDI